MRLHVCQAGRHTGGPTALQTQDTSALLVTMLSYFHGVCRGKLADSDPHPEESKVGCLCTKHGGQGLVGEHLGVWACHAGFCCERSECLMSHRRDVLAHY